MRDPLRRKIMLLERTAGLAEAAAAVAAITVASACRPPTNTRQPPNREAFFVLFVLLNKRNQKPNQNDKKPRE
jgi:hypothetical protein